MLTRSLLAVITLAVGTGCAARASGGDMAARAAPSDLVAATAEPAGWASAAVARCGRLAFDARTACYDELLMEVLRTAGVGRAMETLEQIGALDAETNHHGHVLAHHIGIAAFRSPEQVGEVFASCRPSFQSGCYHGVIQAYFAAVQASPAQTGFGAEPLNRLCEDYRGPDGNRWLLFQCVHGIGHGLVALHDNHLPRALEGCDLLRDAWEQEGCYGGAFMENIVSATMPHHAPRPGQPGGGDHAAHAAGHDHRHTEAHAHHAAPGHAARPAEHRHAAGGHAHAGHGGAHATQAFKQLDPADPHHPCSALGDRYLNACYAMQTSAVLFWSGGEIAPGIRLCEEAPEHVRQTCYVSLGRDINAHSRQNHTEAIRHCLQVADVYQAHCLIGVAKNLIDISADPADGLAFCRRVAAGWNRERCFQAVGEQLAVLEPTPERRAAFCLPLRDEDARGCRFGAGIPERDPAAGSR
jgi:hypothetical protein